MNILLTNDKVEPHYGGRQLDRLVVSKEKFLSKIKYRLERGFFKDGVGGGDGNISDKIDDIDHLMMYIEELFLLDEDSSREVNK